LEFLLTELNKRALGGKLMNRRLQYAIVWMIFAATLVTCIEPRTCQAQLKSNLKSQQAWTLDEAMAQLRLYPKDVYLQYVAMQLANRQNRLAEIADQIDSMRGNEAWEDRSERLSSVDLFSTFSGALAVQESLQLDAMRVNTPPRPSIQALSPEEKKEMESSPEYKRAYEKEARELLAEWQKQRAALELRRKTVMPVARLIGPTVKSHPWAQMLKGQKPEISPLAHYVPEDFYFVEFRSLAKLLDAVDVSDLWGTHLYDQTFREARTHKAGERIKQQLALESNPLARPFYDLVVEEVAVAGSDLFLREGSDVTVLFRFKQPEIFTERMEAFLTNAEKARPDAKRAAGKYLDIDYVELATPDREINVFAAYPAPGLYVRSNSKVAFQRILESVQGRSANGKAIPRLGDSAEFAYIRTLMPRGAKEEDGFVYLSDPFIRKLVGPQLKLTERRRMICYNNLRMIGHASLLYRTEHGQTPQALASLTKSQCAPGTFGEGELACADGGKYSLTSDGAAGVCSRHGQANFMTPCIEIPVTQVNGEEADEYKTFVTQYNQYWRTFFDPIAIRIQATPQRFRLETIILPLIDNSIYSSLASMLGGEPEPLDSSPVPRRNIFSVAVRLNKDSLFAKPASKPGESQSQGLLKSVGISDETEKQLNVTELISRGVGNQFGFHVYDAHPTFDFNLPSFMGMMMGSFNGATSFASTEALIIFAVAALNAPVYISIPVQDAKVVDQFLERLDNFMTVNTRGSQGRGWFNTEQDFYKLPLGQNQTARVYGIQFGPIKLRVFWGRIGNTLYIASKPFILEDLAALDSAQANSSAQTNSSAQANSSVRAESPEAKAADEPQPSHAIARIRSQNWDQVLPDFRLGWAENNREACLSNLGLLSSVGRAFTAGAGADRAASTQSGEQMGQQIHDYADKLYAVHHFCPEDGHYVLSPDGKEIVCSVHGSALAPRQQSAPKDDSAQGKLLRDFAGLTTSLTFMKEGLHAVVVIDRK
jgi:hypothetical protein